jgi:hypothetical protein
MIVAIMEKPKYFFPSSECDRILVKLKFVKNCSMAGKESAIKLINPYSYGVIPLASTILMRMPLPLCRSSKKKNKAE